MIQAFPPEYLEPRWYAAYTRARHEKRVSKQFESRGVESFLPLYEKVHRWKNHQRVRVELPLFPGYVFVRIALRDRLQVLEMPSVVRLVGFNGRAASLPEAEIHAIRTCLSVGRSLKPHPYLQVGQHLRIINGPLRGLEGVLSRRKGKCRLVISVNLISRSVAVDVDHEDLEPSYSGQFSCR